MLLRQLRQHAGANRAGSMAAEGGVQMSGLTLIPPTAFDFAEGQIRMFHG